jgi:hypothetical protein
VARLCERLGGACGGDAALEPRVAVAAADRRLFEAWEAALLEAAAPG